MKVGEIIAGQSKNEYRVLSTLGRPGLFGQAFLCERIGTQDQYVIKALRGDATEETRLRLTEEAATLRRVAQIEKKYNVHYAIRLIDTSSANADEPFIILERATGQNVLDDLIDPVTDWYKNPLPEPLLLDIAWHFARALSYVHEAGLAYNDMKLDNLFWRTELPDDPLRIIDWNVTSEINANERTNDWARFGARLHQMYTGIPIGLDRHGSLVGRRPSGTLWENVPYGIRALIEKALNKGYVDDTMLLADLERERKQQHATVPVLLRAARTADGQQAEATEILAPIWRAEQRVTADPTAQNDEQRREIAELRQRGLARRGQVGLEQLQQIEKLLLENERSVALEQFQRLNQRVQGADPQVRRWLWVAQLASQRTDLYTKFRAALHDAMSKFAQAQYKDAQTALTPSLGSGDHCFGDLYYEACAYEKYHDQQYTDALDYLRQITTLKTTTDLLVFQELLNIQQELYVSQQQEQASAKRIHADVVTSSAAAKQAEDANNYEDALVSTTKAINALADLRRDYHAYLPAIELESSDPLPDKDVLIAQRDRLEAIMKLKTVAAELEQDEKSSEMQSSVFATRIDALEKLQPVITQFREAQEIVAQRVFGEQWQQVQRALGLSAREKFLASVENLEKDYTAIAAYARMDESQRVEPNKERLTELDKAIETALKAGIKTLTQENDELATLKQDIEKRLAVLDPVNKSEFEKLIEQVTKLSGEIEQLTQRITTEQTEQREREATFVTTSDLEAKLSALSGEITQLTERVTDEQTQRNAITTSIQTQRETSSKTDDFLLALTQDDYAKALEIVQGLNSSPANSSLVAELLNAVGVRMLEKIASISYYDFVKSPTVQLLQPADIRAITELVDNLPAADKERITPICRLINSLSQALQQSDLKKRSEQTVQAFKSSPESLPKPLQDALKNLYDIATFFQSQYEGWMYSGSPDNEITAMEVYVADLQRRGVAWELVKDLPRCQSIWKRSFDLYISDLFSSKDAKKTEAERKAAEERCKRYQTIRDSLDPKKKDEELERLKAEVKEKETRQVVIATLEQPEAQQLFQRTVAEQLKQELGKRQSEIQQSLQRTVADQLKRELDNPQSEIQQSLQRTVAERLKLALDERQSSVGQGSTKSGNKSSSSPLQWVAVVVVVLLLLGGVVVAGGGVAGLGQLGWLGSPTTTPTASSTPSTVVPPATATPTKIPTSSTVVPSATATPAKTPTKTPTAIPEPVAEIRLSDIGTPLPLALSPTGDGTAPETAALVFSTSTTSVAATLQPDTAQWLFDPDEFQGQLASYLGSIQETLVTSIGTTESYAIPLQFEATPILTLTLDVKNVSGIPSDPATIPNQYAVPQGGGGNLRVMALQTEPLPESEKVLLADTTRSIALSPNDTVLIMGEQDGQDGQGSWYFVQIVSSADPDSKPTRGLQPMQGWIEKTYVDGNENERSTGADSNDN